MKRKATFDIYAGTFGDSEATWLESVEGLGHAAQRTNEIAIHKPGPYFVLDVPGAVRYRIDTRTALDRSWTKMRVAREEWEKSLEELEQALASSYDLPRTDGSLALRKARSREVEALKMYTLAVRAYSVAALKDRRTPRER